MARPDLHRTRLVETAMRLFRRQGYSATGLNQILAESEARKGSLYHYFPGGKEALADEAIRLAGQLQADMLAELARRHAGEPAAFVRAWCRTMAGWLEESDFRSGCPIATTVLETVPGSTALTLTAVNILNSWTTIVAGVLTGAGEASASALRRAETLVAGVEGALLLCRIRQSRAPLMAIADQFARGWARDRG